MGMFIFNGRHKNWLFKARERARHDYWNKGKGKYPGDLRTPGGILASHSRSKVWRNK